MKLETRNSEIETVSCVSTCFLKRAGYVPAELWLKSFATPAEFQLMEAAQSRPMPLKRVTKSSSVAQAS
jgi:hypothetical protein